MKQTDGTKKRRDYLWKEIRRDMGKISFDFYESEKFFILKPSDFTSFSFLFFNFDNL